MTDESHARAVEAWREERYSRLRSDVGWLTLAGLDWLKPGDNRVGADPASDVRLPSGPPNAGTITVGEEGVRASGDFIGQGDAAESVELTSDLEGEPTMLELGRPAPVPHRARRSAWRPQLGHRLQGSPRLHRDRSLAGRPCVAPRRALRADARPRASRCRTSSASSRTSDSPGTVSFEVDGVAHRLQALPGGPEGELWLVFADETNGRETYGGGRFLYTDPPGEDGRVVVDFNRSYNPPCVFSPYATCPLPWRANRLPIRVEAGERTFEAH